MTGYLRLINDRFHCPPDAPHLHFYWDGYRYCVQLKSFVYFFHTASETEGTLPAEAPVSGRKALITPRQSRISVHTMSIRKWIKKITKSYHREAYDQLNELINRSYQPQSGEMIRQKELEQLKDITFGEILNSASDPTRSVDHISRQMIYAIRDYFKGDVIVSLHKIIRPSKRKYESLLMEEGIGYDDVLYDIDHRPLASFCVFDTFLGPQLKKLKFNQRAFAIRNQSIFERTYSLGEGVVNVDDDILADEMIKKTQVKRIHYGPFVNCKWFEEKIKLGFAVHEYNKKRMSYPVYNHDMQNPDIAYIIIIDSKTYTQFTSDQIRAVRGFETYTSSSIKIKKLNETLEEIRLKNKELAEKDKKLVQTIATGAHSIKTPLSIMNYTIEGLGQFVHAGKIPDMEQLKTGLERLEHALEQITERVATLDMAATKYEMRPLPFDSFVKQVCALDCREGTTYGREVHFHFDLKAKTVSKDGETRDIFVMLDRVQFRKVLYDMIINTYEKCMEEGKKAIFTVKTRAIGPSAIGVLLQDNLGGMSDTQFHDFLYKEGCQTSKEKGSGLGTRTIKRYFTDINTHFPKGSIKYYPINQSHKGFGIYLKIPVTSKDQLQVTFFVPI